MNERPERGSPEWLAHIQGARGNTAVLEALTGQTVDEETATQALAAEEIAQGAPAAEAGQTTGDTGSATTVDAETAGAESEAGSTEAKDAAPRPNKYTSTATTEDKTLSPVLDKHKKSMKDGVGLQLRSGRRFDHKWDLDQFVKHWTTHKARYVKIEGKTGVPAKLIAAIHYRERSGSFNHYLAQGDPVGTVPVNKPHHKAFDNWDDAAVHALNVSDKKHNQTALGVDKDTRDPAVLATYSEAYNGLGYHNRGKTSAYIYSGTDEYKGGKYVSDGVWNDSAIDAQIGIMPMMGAIDGVDGFDYSSGVSSSSGDSAKGGKTWADVLAGKSVLKRSDRGEGVTAAQKILVELGHLSTTTFGFYGSKTKAAVIAFQNAETLTPDGAIGKDTAAKLKAKAS